MEFLKRNFDQLALAIATLAVIGTAAFIIVHLVSPRTPSADPIDRTLQWVKEGRQGVPPPLDTKQIEDVKEKVVAPPVWTNEQPLFSSVPRTLVGGTLVPATNAPSRQIEQELCDWLKSYKLPCTAGVDKEDPDKDGWTNREEWKFKTNPTIGVSFPRIDQCVEFVRAIPEVFPLKFTGYVKAADERYSFQVNVIDSGETLFVVANDQVILESRKEAYLVQNFKQAFKSVTDSTILTTREKDVSQLTLSRVKDGKRVVLTYGEELPEGYSKAEMINRLEEKPVTVSKGDKVRVKDRTYTVTDILKDSVVMIDPKGLQVRIVRTQMPSGR